MGTFGEAAREGIVDKALVEVPVELTVERAVDDTISHCRFVNDSWFGIIDFEFVIGAVTVGVVGEVSVKHK